MEVLKKSMNKLSAVFWDVDGTIADTELCGHRVAFNLAFKDFDLDWHWNEIKYLELLKTSGGLNRIMHYRDEIHSDLTNDTCKQIQSRKRHFYKKLIHSGQIKVRNGVLRLINELADLNIEQLIVTTSGRDSLEPFLQTSLHSCINFFSHIITYEDVNNHKPYPDAYNLAVELSNKSSFNCLAIEDSNIGCEAAKAANINCLLTVPPWSSTYNKVTNEANACVDNLGDINIDSKLIYGKQLITKFVDFTYLTTIIN